MTTSTTDYRPLLPFDSVYTIVFIILMYHLLGNTIADIINVSISIEAKFYQILVTLFFFYQLSRMYYYLKNFEDIISKQGNHHFLEILPIGFQSTEKIIRLLLSLIIVLLSKFQTQTSLLSSTLLFCFAILMFWDIIVIVGLKNYIKNNQNINGNESLQTAKSFFYLLDDELKNNRIYLFKTKFFERFFGLLASITAYLYQSQTDSSNGILMLFFIFFVALFILAAYYGKFKIQELKLSEMDGFIDDVLRPFYLPIYKLIHNLNFIK